MKKNFLVLIIALLVILVISLSTAVILMLSDDGTGNETSSETQSTETKPSETNAPKTDIPDTEAPETKPSETQPQTKPASPETLVPETDAPETTPVGPITPAPDDLDKTVTLTTDTGTKLNLRAVCQMSVSKNENVTLYVSLYLDHSAIGVGSRTAKLTVGSDKQSIKVPSISVSESGKYSTLIGSYTGEYMYGDTVKISANYQFRGSYGETKIDSLNIDDEIVLTI